MTTTIAISDPTVDIIQNLAADLRQFVTSLQRPKPRDRSWKKAIRNRSQELNKRFGQIREKLNTRRQSFSAMTDDLRNTLQSLAQELAQKSSRQRLKELQAALLRKYEDFIAQLNSSNFLGSSAKNKLQSIRLPRAARSIFHMSIGVVSVLLYQLIFSQQQAVIILSSVLAVFVGLEISRRFSIKFNDFMVDRLFGMISRPQERYKTNSATYYLLALTIITLVTPKPAVCLALLVLAIGDPVASLVGSRWGKIILVNDKSLIGSTSFFCASLMVTLGFLLVTANNLAIQQSLVIALSISAVGTFTELFSQKFDDNFTVPVACALCGLIWF
jgi:dolichol kinase